MARTAEGTTLTKAHRAEQLALRAKIIRDVVRLFPLWDPRDPETYQRFEDAMVVLTQAGFGDSAVLAARYYKLFRKVDAPSKVADLAQAVAVATLPPEAQIRAAVSSTARAGVYRGLGAGQTIERATANGLVEVSGAVSRLSLKGGRDTIQHAVLMDSAALGYARVTGSEPCAFCAMLASRGPVYKEQTVAFRAHDHCSCSAEPVYEGAEWPGRAREFRALWNESGSLNTFRSALAGGTP